MIVKTRQPASPNRAVPVFVHGAMAALGFVQPTVEARRKWFYQHGDDGCDDEDDDHVKSNKNHDYDNSGDDSGDDDNDDYDDVGGGEG